jgi:arylsulfatase A-like enzyme
VSARRAPAPGPRRARSRRLLAGLLAAGALGAPGCGARETLLVPTARLADELWRGRGRVPLATIDRDTRPVLASHAALRVYDERALALPPGGEIRLRIPVPAPLAGHAALVLEAFAQGDPRREPYRRELARSVAVQRDAGGAFVALDLRIEPARARRERGAPPRVALFVEARAPAQAQAFDAPELALPADGLLEVAFGVLEAAWDAGPVAFRVLACPAAGACEVLLAETLDPSAPERGRWRQRQIPLGAHAGGRARLRFEAEPLAAGGSLPVIADPTLLRRVPRGPRDLDLLLVSLDTLRADHLPSYGYLRDTAPFLASLAARGALFERALAAAPSTTPSHMTLFTSLPPSVHGLLGNETLTVLPPGAATLAEALRGAGFATGAVTEGGGIALHYGFERGFDAYVENPVPIPHRPGLQSPVTFDAGLAWLRANPQRRAFLFLHTYEVHGPYRAPERYRALFAQGPPELAEDPRLRPHQRPVHYDREIRFADDELRRLFAALEADGRLERTLVVVTSDHGEEFLEHGYIGHGATLPDLVLRVPLLAVGPGIPAGLRVDAPVGLLDLAPTLLELLGAPALPGAMGRSFAALLRGEEPEAAWRERPLFAETWFVRGFGAEGPKPVTQPSYAVQAGSRKLVRLRTADGFRYAYYDLALDPGERHDLYAADPRAAADLRALLDAYPEQAAARRRALLGAPAEGDAGVGPEREAQLRALGYLE